MVHLASVPKDNEISKSLVNGMDKVKLAEHDDQDAFTTSVYGSKFASQDLPKHEMPEREMPKEVAYRMIKDDLSLDGNPMLKYGVSLLVGLKEFC
jgi:glutamate decarboxylase